MKLSIFLSLGVILLLLGGCQSCTSALRIPQTNSFDKIEVYKQSGTTYAYSFGISDDTKKQKIVDLLSSYNRNLCPPPFGTSPILPYYMSFRDKEDVILVVHFGNRYYGAIDENFSFVGKGLSEQQISDLEELVFQ